MDMVKDHLLDKYSENELLSQNFRVYTTLDPALERDAVSAVEAGMKNVDTLLAKRYDKWKRELAKKGSDEPVPQVQVALVALDPRNGEIKAVVGGTDWLRPCRASRAADGARDEHSADAGRGAWRL